MGQPNYAAYFTNVYPILTNLGSWDRIRLVIFLVFFLSFLSFFLFSFYYVVNKTLKEK